MSCTGKRNDIRAKACGCEDDFCGRASARRSLREKETSKFHAMLGNGRSSRSKGAGHPEQNIDTQLGIFNFREINIYSPMSHVA